MDDQRFDALVRSVAGAPSRRRLLGALVGGLAATVLPRVGSEAEAARCLALGKRCERGDDCCAGRCRGGRCRCSTTQKRCGAICIPDAACCKDGRRVEPEPIATTCQREGCGEQVNNCGQPVTCPCQVGQVCTAEGTCCTPAPDATTCQGQGCRATNNCGQLVECGCPTGQTCLDDNITCCASNRVCNDNAGNQVCCANQCNAGVCCPCDRVGTCQQCVTNTITKQATCQVYCPFGKICTPNGCQ